MSRDRECRRAEPIALIGAACRFPGASDPEEFWQILQNGRDVIGDVPPERWDVDTYYDPSGEAPGTMYTRCGGFLAAVDEFDADALGISPREAREMDPQQRIALECAWDALDCAGQSADRLAGTSTGVYLGLLGSDYLLLHTRTVGLTRMTPYFGSGKEASFAAGRLSYLLGVHGPSMTVSTACSSSLVALHLACQSLQVGESDVAIAGGASMVLTPDLTLFLCKVGAISRTGRCRAFDAAADGIVRGEGCGVVVLKRLADAIADRDPILAVIRGTAVNHNGRSAGLTAPSGVAQESLLRQALNRAGLAPDEVSFVETHGTGTPLGDPIEVSAIASVYGPGRAPDAPLFLGALKTNFGHMDAAAGIAGVIKVAMALKHRRVPPNLHLETPNPLIPWAKAPFVLPRTPTAWEPATGRRIAGVSAFGLSGINGHVLIEEPPAVTAPGPTCNPAELRSQPSLPVLLPISAHSQHALRALAAAYADMLDRTAGPAGFAQLAATAALRRSQLRHRIGVVARSSGEAAQMLRAYAQGADEPALAVAPQNPATADKRPLVFVFPGQGSQWPGMARLLLDEYAEFRDAVTEVDNLLRTHTDWSVLDVLRDPSPARLADTAVAQPAIFAVQVGLVALLARCGVRPAAVVGHSFGEVAAAYVAGALSLPDAVRVIYHRGHIMQSGRGGGMLAVAMAPHDAREVASAYLDLVSVAAINSQRSVVLAGDRGALREIENTLDAREVFARELDVDYAFHSSQMARFGAPIERALAEVNARCPTLPIVSSIVPGGSKPPTFNGAYWGHGVASPVRFADSVQRLIDDGYRDFLEVGPARVLGRALRECLTDAGAQGVVLSSLQRHADEDDNFKRCLAGLFATGSAIDFSPVHPLPTQPVELPRYPWQRKRYWIDVAPGEQGRPAAGPSTTQPVCGRVVLYDDAGQPVGESETFVVKRRHAHPGSELPRPVSPPADPSVTVSAQRRCEPAPGSTDAVRVTRLVQAEVTRALGLDAGTRVDPRRGFFDLGMDSITATELKARLATELGLPLAKTVVFDHPTVTELAAYLTQQLATVPTATVTAPADEPARPAPTGLAPTGTAPPARVCSSAPAAAPPAASTPAVTRCSGEQRFDPEPIAIVGIGCRLPGGVNGPRGYWRLLRDGVDAISDIPQGRFEVDEYYDPNPGAPGKMYVRRGGFVDHVDQLDNVFFRISPREARAMDPQQRLFLEVGWEALEDAGIDPRALARTDTGVFVGMNSNDYLQLLTRNSGNIDGHYGPGNSFCGSAGRLSYFLGLQGPSMAVDTACSSSLVATHLACQSLRSDECQIAVASGVHLILAPTVYVSISDLGALAPDGICKTFDAAANGYVRGEGCGAVVLKRLSRALGDGDRVYAVIRGSAVNQDGPSSGLTVPNGPAQQAVVARALRMGGIEPQDVTYIEAHGTGTPIGDPIELGALAAALRGDPTATHPLYVGSVKTNIGHLEAAAGIAGLIKAALSLHRGQIAPHLHFATPNPQAPWDAGRLEVPTRLLPWADRPRVAGVSSFGMTGTNAHVVLEGPPPTAHTSAAATAPAATSSPLRPQVLTLSARTPRGLRNLIGGYLDLLAADDVPDIADIAFSAARRAHHRHRLAVVGRSPSDWRTLLEAFAGVESDPGLALGDSINAGKVAFVCSGYGGQWPGMARDLLANEPAFRDAVETCDRNLRRYRDWSVVDALHAGDSRGGFRRGAMTQELVFAVQLGLAAFWTSRGISPGAVVGHSMGEVAAAHIAGALSLADAARVLCGRASALARNQGVGAMALVGLSQDDAQHAIAGDSRLAVAAANSPRATVVAGDRDAVDRALQEFKARNVFARLVQSETAGHCHLVDPLRDQLVDALAGLAPGDADIELYSTVTGRREPGTLFDAHYWGRNIREPVLFTDAIARLIADGYTTFIELSPHPVLASSLHDCLRAAERTGRVIASMRRDADAAAVLAHGLGALYVSGVDVDRRWLSEGGRIVSLPTYPWERRRFWIDQEIAESTEPKPERAAIATPDPAAAVDNLARMPVAERRDIITIRVLEQAAEVLGFARADDLELDQGFFELGMNSVMAVRLKASLENWLGCALPATLAFECPSAADLVRFVDEQVVAARAEHVQEMEGSAERVNPPPRPATATDPNCPTETVDLVDLLEREIAVATAALE
jgi:acyl transferase domain-containing protein